MWEEYLAPLMSELYRWIVLVGATIWSVLASVMGDHLEIFNWLVAFVTIDWVTGCIAAYRTGTVSSKVGGIGVIKKLLILVVGVCFHGLGQVTGIGWIGLWGMGALCTNEMISILENIERGGFGSVVPPFIKHAISKVQEQQKEELNKKLGATND